MKLAVYVFILLLLLSFVSAQEEMIFDSETGECDSVCIIPPNYEGNIICLQSCSVNEMSISGNGKVVGDDVILNSGTLTGNSQGNDFELSGSGKVDQTGTFTLTGGTLTTTSNGKPLTVSGSAQVYYTGLAKLTGGSYKFEGVSFEGTGHCAGPLCTIYEDGSGVINGNNIKGPGMYEAVKVGYSGKVKTTVVLEGGTFDDGTIQLEGNLAYVKNPDGSIDLVLEDSGTTFSTNNGMTTMNGPGSMIINPDGSIRLYLEENGIYSDTVSNKQTEEIKGPAQFKNGKVTLLGGSYSNSAQCVSGPIPCSQQSAGTIQISGNALCNTKIKSCSLFSGTVNMDKKSNSFWTINIGDSVVGPTYLQEGSITKMSDGFGKPMFTVNKKDTQIIKANINDKGVFEGSTNIKGNAGTQIGLSDTFCVGKLQCVSMGSDLTVIGKDLDIELQQTTTSSFYDKLRFDASDDNAPITVSQKDFNGNIIGSAIITPSQGYKGAPPLYGISVSPISESQQFINNKGNIKGGVCTPSTTSSTGSITGNYIDQAISITERCTEFVKVDIFQQEQSPKFVIDAIIKGKHDGELLLTGDLQWKEGAWVKKEILTYKIGPYIYDRQGLLVAELSDDNQIKLWNRDYPTQISKLDPIIVKKTPLISEAEDEEPDEDFEWPWNNDEDSTLIIGETIKPTEVSSILKNNKYDKLELETGWFTGISGVVTIKDKSGITKTIELKFEAPALMSTRPAHTYTIASKGSTYKGDSQLFYIIIDKDTKQLVEFFPCKAALYNCRPKNS